MAAQADTDRLAEIEARERLATPGPWETSEHYHFGEWPTGFATGVWAPNPGEFLGRTYGPDKWATVSEDYSFIQDAEFIAHARQDIPWLLEHVERLQHEVIRLATERDRLTAERDAALRENEQLKRAASALADDYEAMSGDGMTWETQPAVLKELKQALGDPRE